MTRGAVGSQEGGDLTVALTGLADGLWTSWTFACISCCGIQELGAALGFGLVKVRGFVEDGATKLANVVPAEGEMLGHV